MGLRAIRGAAERAWASPCRGCDGPTTAFEVLRRVLLLGLENVFPGFVTGVALLIEGIGPGFIGNTSTLGVESISPGLVGYVTRLGFWTEDMPRCFSYDMFLYVCDLGR